MIFYFACFLKEVKLQGFREYLACLILYSLHELYSGNNNFEIKGMNMIKIINIYVSGKYLHDLSFTCMICLLLALFVLPVIFLLLA